MSDFVKGLIKIIIILAIVIILLVILANLFNKKGTTNKNLKSGIKQVTNIRGTNNNTNTTTDTDTSTNNNQVDTAIEVDAPDTAASDYLTPLVGITVLTIGSYSIYRYRKESN